MVLWVGSSPHSCNPLLRVKSPSQGRELSQPGWQGFCGRHQHTDILVQELQWFCDCSPRAFGEAHSPGAGTAVFSLSAVMSQLGQQVGRGGPVKKFDTNHMASLISTVEIAVPAVVINRLLVASRAWLTPGCGRQGPTIAANQASTRKRNQARILKGKYSRYKFFWRVNSSGLGGIGILMAEHWVDKVSKSSVSPTDFSN